MSKIEQVLQDQYGDGSGPAREDQDSRLDRLGYRYLPWDPGVVYPPGKVDAWPLLGSVTA